jgi:alpha-glucoside transport system substrate-binding protein
LVRSILDYFTKPPASMIKYSSSENYEQQIVIDTQAGSPPNIAILPQPGLIQDLASKGLLDAARRRHSKWVKDNYGAGDSLGRSRHLQGQGRQAGFFAFPYKADVKSLVWYVPENFEEAGYKVPKTMEELQARNEDRQGRRQAVVHRSRLRRRHRLAGDRLGRRPDAAHPAAEVYDKWTKNEIPFNDPAVVNAHRHLRQDRHRRQVCRRRRQGGCRDRLPRQPEGPLRGSAEMLPAPPGVVHPVLLPGRHEARPGRRLLLHAALRLQA